MGSAYTPGLTVSANTIIRKTRRLPIKGDVLVTQGQSVEPSAVIARAMLPGILQNIKLAEMLGIDPKDVESQLSVPIGGTITKGQVIAQSKGLFGLFKSTFNSPYEGTVESISEFSGHVQVREPSTPVERTAYIRGEIVEIIPLEGAVIETRGALIQGIFGVGGERLGEIFIYGDEKSTIFDANDISDNMAGKVVVCCGGITGAALKKAEQVGVLGLVVASLINDLDLKDYLGHDIGVAITGQENIPLSLILTEGFGKIQMADRTFSLLKSLQGNVASINGTTQIRAGVQRPEIIVPSTSDSTKSVSKKDGGDLTEGTPIRVIREPYFGQLGSVTRMPSELTVVESGAHVRVLEAKLSDGSVVIVPRANVEIIAE